MTKLILRSALAVSVLLAACSPTETQLPNVPQIDAGAALQPAPRIADGFRSGTRIALLYAQDVPPTNAGRGFLPAQFPVSLWDNLLQAPCRVGTTSDGRRRCIPDAAESSGYFADNRCTMPLFTGGNCGEFKRYVQESVGCTLVIFKAQLVQPSAYYIESSGACTAVAAPSTSGGAAWYLRGQRIADAELAEIGLLIGRPG